MIQVKESKNHYINATALSFGENDLENPNRVAVSLVGGAAILVHVKGTIDYAADGNFRRWTLKGYSTKLAANTPHYIYARLDRSAPEALITFSVNRYALDGSIEGDSSTAPSTRYWYVRIGEITETDGVTNRELTYDSGLLGTDKGINENNSALEEMFELSKQSTPWLIRVKHWFESLTIRGALTLMGNLIFGGKTLRGVATSDNTDSLNAQDDEHLTTSKYVATYVKENTEDKFLRKDQDDETPYNLTAKGLKSETVETKDITAENIDTRTITATKKVTAGEEIEVGEKIVTKDFISGSNGAGLYQNEQGNWCFETDYLDVRYKFTATEVDILHTSHIGGRLIATAAQMTVTNVVETETSYLCYMNLTDTEGRTVYNMWKPGDQAYCQTFNLTTQSDGKVGNHFLWRYVISRGDDYIELSKTNCAINSDAPVIGDELTLLGSQTDTDRQGAIILSATGSGSPYIRVYKDVNSFSLPAPKLNLSPQEVSMIADSITLQTTGEDLESALQKIRSDVNNVSNQLDSSFYIWQGETKDEPTLQNEPAINWATDEDKHLHVNDYYITTDGLCYQFYYDGSTFYWKIVTDKYLIKYVEELGQKKRVFVKQPDTDDVYDIGDTWVNATYNDNAADIHYNNDRLVCIQQKDKGDTFSISHWQKDSGYTDDTVANLVKQELKDFKDDYEKTIPLIQKQVDGKAETWYQDNDPSISWENKSEHIGDLWYKTSTGETSYFDGTKWNKQNIPTAVFDRFDAKASIYVSKPSAYKVNDMWILESKYTLYNNEVYDKGTLVFSSSDSETFNASHWKKYDKYTDDTVANNLKTGLIETGINIEDKTITVTAESFIVQDNNGKKYFAFEVDESKGTLKSKATLEADQINFLGKTIINGSFIVDEQGNLSLKNIYMSGNIYTPFFRVTSSNWSNVVRIEYERFTYLQLEKTGFNVQLDYWVDLTPSSSTANDTFNLPEEEVYVGCEVNLLNLQNATNEIYYKVISVENNEITPYRTSILPLPFGHGIKLKLLDLSSFSGGVPAYGWIKIEEYSLV